MAIPPVVWIAGIGSSGLFCIYLFWRRVWFFRNPSRLPPPGGSILSPADGRVVYVRHVQSREAVLSIKKGVPAPLEDMAPTDLEGPKILIGVFMSPWDVHYNRAPLSGTVEWIRHHPARGRNLHMTLMHLRTLFRIPPFFAGSLHVIRNERTVTKFRSLFRGNPMNFYVIQIAGGSVRGIEIYVPEGGSVTRGEIFGMIRIGSQVDLVVPALDGMRVRVQPGQKVRAGETILID